MIIPEPTNEQRERFLKMLSRTAKNRPAPDRRLDQVYATPETVLRRAVLLGALLDLSRKTIVFLGDDDLTSIAVALLFPGLRISVVDIDVRLLHYLEKASKEEGLEVEMIEHDLQTPLPRAVFRDFDLCFFDPPYTPQALDTWITRAIEASLARGTNQMRKNADTLQRKRFVLCYGYTDRETERGLQVQLLLSEHRLLIEEKVRDFNQYHGAMSLGSKSDLYILQPTPKINLREIDHQRSRFYTGEQP